MRFSIFSVVLFIPCVMFAQKNFQPGYIVNLKGDTTSGVVDYKEWDFSPTHILFKSSDPDANPQEYTVRDITAFDITGNESYRRFTVKISLNPVKITDVGSRDTSWKIDTVFLRVVHAGKLISLLSYRDRIKERFYVLKAGEQQPSELIMREYFNDNSTSLVTENMYKDQLLSLVDTQNPYADKILNEISAANYEEDDFKKIVLLINGTSNESFVEGKMSKRVFWFAGAGLQQDKIRFGGNNEFADYPTNTSSNWLPKVSVGFDFFANPNVGKLYYRVEASYQVDKSTTTANISRDVKYVYQLSSSTVSLIPQINYTLYNTARVKIPVGAGFGYSLISYSKNQFKKVYSSGAESSPVDNFLDLKKGVVTILTRASVVFNNKIELSLVYRPYAALTKTVAYGMSTSCMQLQGYFLFRTKKQLSSPV